MTGSEGLLGIVTSVTVKLLPRPQAAQVLLAAFKRVEDAGNGVAAVIAAGIIPAGLEMMDRLAIQAAEDFVHAGYPLDAEAILLCEIDGHPAEIEAELPRVAEASKLKGRRKCAWRETRANGSASGPGARPPSRPSGGCPRLLLHGRHHPAPAARSGARSHQRAVARVRTGRGQRFPYGRR